MKNGVIPSEISSDKSGYSLFVYMVCFYIFIFIERPWESVSYFNGISIERYYAVIMIFMAFLNGKIKISYSPVNKWVYSLLAIHFLLAPFAFKPGFALDQGIDYGKMVILYMLMLAISDDERYLKLLVKAFVISMMFYMLHSIWQYSNGRHLYRMGISRMMGADATYNDPNAFGASVVLSLPFAYALFRTEIIPIMRKFYLCYVALALLCIVLTGSRSASVAFVFLLLLFGFNQKRISKILMLLVIIFSLGAIWLVMPAEKQGRIMTLWDDESGPRNAYSSARGRLAGLKVSWEMFKREPFTGVGAGGANFIGYRMANGIDEPGAESPTQSHNLYGQVIAEFGVIGTALFVGMVFSIWRCALIVRKKASLEGRERDYRYVLSEAIIASLLALLLLGLAGHNFYRPLWLWLAAWSGALYSLNKKDVNMRIQ
ncbi:MAG: O-antigen ligase family protein [Desulfobulbus sp.]|nr:O-antigen ligase family protein [Desulfobulbus sp.]